MKKLTVILLLASGISSRAQTLKATEALALLNVEVINDTKKPLEMKLSVSFLLRLKKYIPTLQKQTASSSSWYLKVINTRCNTKHLPLTKITAK
jgi:hypothetical protein